MPPTLTVSEPPTQNRMPTKVTAASRALMKPMANSTTGSEAMRRSSAMRYSGLICSSSVTASR